MITAEGNSAQLAEIHDIFAILEATDADDEPLGYVPVSEMRELLPHLNKPLSDQQVDLIW